MNEILPILNMFLQQNLFRKRYFQNLKKILKKFKRIQKNQRTHLTQKKTPSVYLLDNNCFAILID